MISEEDTAMKTPYGMQNEMLITEFDAKVQTEGPLKNPALLEKSTARGNRNNSSHQNKGQLDYKLLCISLFSCCDCLFTIPSVMLRRNISLKSRGGNLSAAQVEKEREEAERIKKDQMRQAHRNKENMEDIMRSYSMAVGKRQQDSDDEEEDDESREVL
jgi:hypothetical protein